LPLTVKVETVKNRVKNNGIIITFYLYLHLMASTTDFVIWNNSIQLKKEVRAIAKNKGKNYGRVLREFFKELTKDLNITVIETGITTTRKEFIIKNNSVVLKQKIDALAKSHGVTTPEYLRGKIIAFVEAHGEKEKSYID